MADVWTIICSPVSGKRRGRRFVEEELIPELRARGIAHEVFYTQHFQHAKELAKGRSKIICVGGDGTANEVLESCPPQSTVAVVSQGTMNFFGVCADLPGTGKEIADLIASKSTRPCSLMKNADKPGSQSSMISFEGLHIGPMAHRVCKGAQDWRFTPLGSMFGIMMHLVLGNADPKHNKQSGTLKFWPVGDGPTVTITDDFFWIIMTYRNPYNGVVGNDLWLSWMPLSAFPGFGRMMKFFEPQMEHFQGTSRCFPFHAKVSRVEFTASGSTTSNGNDIALVLDGDPKDCGRVLTVDHMYGAFNVIAKEEPPKRVNTTRIAVGGGKLTQKPLTKAAKKWLTMHPPPKGVEFPEPLEVPEEGSSVPVGTIVLGAIFVGLVLYVRRRKPIGV